MNYNPKNLINWWTENPQFSNNVKLWTKGLQKNKKILSKDSVVKKVRNKKNSDNYWYYAYLEYIQQLCWNQWKTATKPPKNSCQKYESISKLVASVLKSTQKYQNQFIAYQQHTTEI